MAKYNSYNPATNVSAPGKSQPIGPVKPSQLIVTAIGQDSIVNGAKPNSYNPAISSVRKPPAGYHYMPDGTLMADSAMLTGGSTGVDVVLQQQSEGVVLPFGAQTNPITSYPNDVVRFDLYNANNQWLGVNYRIDDYRFKPTTQGPAVALDVERNIQQLGYLAGRYNFVYKFHRNILGSGDPEGHKLSIQEISYNGLEIRVRPIFSSLIDNSAFARQFEEGIFNIKKSELITNLFLFKESATNGTTDFQVFDFVQDKFTITTSPYSIIFKLTSPVPAGVVVGDELWLAQQVSDDYSDIATLTPPSLTPPLQYIHQANFDILSRTGTGISTNYKDRDDLLTTNTELKYQLQDKVVSGSLVEGINLNQDFRKFEEFIHYSSAEGRLRGFSYKLRSIESYNDRIKELTVDLNGLPSSSASGSTAFLANIETTKNRRSAVIGGLDAYERYLYYESASYESSSFGEFYPSTWPKSNSTKPYVNVSVTSSEGVSWFTGAIQSASIHDTSNAKNLARNTPAHIVEDSDNENYLTLLNTVGHYFDDILPYIEQITSQYDRNQSLSAGLSKDLLFVVGQNLGFEFENGNALDDLWEYALGVDATGSVNNIYETTTEDTMKEIWKRIINNLPYLLKTKGTERGLRALINCFGIPDTILRIREYGGHEASFETKTDLVFNKFYYSLKVGYTGQTSASPNASVKIPWQAVSQSGLFPETVQLRVKMAASQSKNQTIFEVPDRWKVQAFVSGGYGYLGVFLSGSQGWATASVSSSIYNGNWHNIALRRENSTDTITDNQVYTLIAKESNYLKIIRTESASLSINGGTSSSYNNTFVTSGSLWMPGSGSFTIAQSHSMAILSGSVQEFRYWASAISNEVLDNHTLSPTSFQGNTDGIFTGSTSSFESLAYRLTLGTDGKKLINSYYPITSSFNSQHPNQSIKLPSASFYNFTSSAYIAVIEEVSTEWPDLGANRSVGNKVRIDTTVLNGNQLYLNARAEKPLTDNYPPDSPRLGIYLSPTNEVNQDIAEQFGGISIDDYIGDPTYLELDNYPALVQLQREYGKKYTQINKPNQYARILQHYNSALFQLIKKFVPYRANTQVGLVLEPLLIERSKFTVKAPTVSDDHYTGSIDLFNPFPPSGVVEDPTNTPLSNYVQEATIGGDEADYLTLEGFAEQIIPINDNAIEITRAMVGGEAFLEANGTTDLGTNAAGWESRYKGTKYVYMTYMSSGSNPRVLTYQTASRYDDYEAVEPAIIDNTYSQHFAPGNQMYDRDIYNLKLFTGRRAFTASVEFSSSYGTSKHPLTDQYGLRIASSYESNAALYGSGLYGSGTYGAVSSPLSPFTSSFYWSIDNTNGLYFKPYAQSGSYTGSVAIDAFMYEPTSIISQDYLYQVSITTQLTGSGGSPTLLLYFGGFDSPISRSITLTTQAQTTTYVLKATGTELAMRMQKATFTSSEFMKILNLSVTPLNYRAQVQDYHLLTARGMVNARYEGCKMTSTDYNVDSPDTIDNGPVITVIQVGGTILTASPSNQPGTFQIR